MGSQAETILADAFPDDPLTSPGTTLGTVAYMSPEQARAEEIDNRSDLFSLGVMLYEMVTASVPFRGNATAVVFDGILNKDPVRPSQLNPAVPPELERLILRTLEKDRDLRYQTAADVRSDLKRVQKVTDSDRVVARKTASEIGRAHV